jgi:hypothetical protein
MNLSTHSFGLKNSFFFEVGFYVAPTQYRSNGDITSGGRPRVPFHALFRHERAHE